MRLPGRRDRPEGREPDRAGQRPACGAEGRPGHAGRRPGRAVRRVC